MSPTQTVFAAATVVATRVNGEFWATHCVLQSTVMGVSAILTDIDVELSRLQQAPTCSPDPLLQSNAVDAPSIFENKLPTSKPAKKIARKRTMSRKAGLAMPPPRKRGGRQSIEVRSGDLREDL